jgi:hypothetical protein
MAGVQGPGIGLKDIGPGRVPRAAFLSLRAALGGSQQEYRNQTNFRSLLSLVLQLFTGNDKEEKWQ